MECLGKLAMTAHGNAMKFHCNVLHLVSYVFPIVWTYRRSCKV